MTFGHSGPFFLRENSGHETQDIGKIAPTGSPFPVAGFEFPANGYFEPMSRGFSQAKKAARASYP